MSSPYLRLTLVLVALPVALFALSQLLLPHQNPGGTCEGIGFGCALPPADVAALLFALAAVPLATAWATGIAWLQLRSRRPGLARRPVLHALAAFAIGAVTVIVVLSALGLVTQALGL